MADQQHNADHISFKRVDTIPPMGVTFGKVAAGAITPKKGKQTLRLNDTGWETAGVRITRAQVDEFNQLFPPTGSVGHDSAPSLAVHIATFPVTMAMMAEKSFPLPLLGMVHLEHHVWHYHDVGIDQDLTIRVWAENLAAHHAGVTADMWAQVFDDEKRLVWQSKALYLARGLRLDGEERPERPEHEKMDMTGATGEWRLPKNLGRQYAKVSGDVNPIHMSALSAKMLGMKSAIAHGMYAAAKMLVGREPQAPFEWDIRFFTPMQLPGKVDVAYETTKDGFTVRGWNARKQRPNFQASVTRL